MFAGFREDLIDVDGRNVFVRCKGVGEPLLLLHGFPQTHVMWHRIAIQLADSFFVVCADLPGYGRSEAPPPSPDHAAHSKRSMSTTLAKAMSRLGFERWSVAGHDRGGRVAYRMALDHADQVLKSRCWMSSPRARCWIARTLVLRRASGHGRSCRSLPRCPSVCWPPTRGR